MRKVVVIDRNLTAGLGGVFASEIRSALYPLEQRPVLFPFVSGLGGRDVTPRDVEGMIRFALSREKPETDPMCWGLKE
jgi:pyruvate/2-oxoacid:ferredoxin oxidoreductase alpha subunit